MIYLFENEEQQTSANHVGSLKAAATFQCKKKKKRDQKLSNVGSYRLWNVVIFLSFCPKNTYVSYAHPEKRATKSPLFTKTERRDLSPPKKIAPFHGALAAKPADHFPPRPPLQLTAPRLTAGPRRFSYHSSSTSTITYSFIIPAKLFSTAVSDIRSEESQRETKLSLALRGQQ